MDLGLGRCSSFSLRKITLTLEIHSEIHNNALALQIPNLNAGFSSSTEPVPVRAEAKSMNDRSSLKAVKLLSFGQIPEENNSIFPSAGTQRAIGGNRNGVHVPCVAGKSGTKLAVGQIPHLHSFIPRSRDDRGMDIVRAESNARNPLAVTVGVLNSVLALAESVPQLNCLVPGRGNNLTIIDGKRHGKDVLSVADEPTRSGSRLEVPETELSVPRTGESELAVGRENNVLDEVRMSGEAAMGDVDLRAVFRETPVDQRFVTGSGDDDVGVIHRSSDGRDPIGVGLHGSAEAETFVRHFRPPLFRSESLELGKWKKWEKNSFAYILVPDRDCKT
ncbi:hypothetical protein DM860_010285 [Cuscuta australis]|uniref:Uncharacterized protein n=1 Tax=Cuscuta australis TaxID=267555 RepID=A0A328DB04_9ASTE|nr:hypothetical protein DM860_010285 [Cuscuta australis]